MNNESNEMLTIIEKNEKLKSFIFNKFQQGELNNSTLVQIIELCGQFLNLKTIPDYAKENNMSYNGVKNNREIIEIFNTKFVIDNK